MKIKQWLEIEIKDADIENTISILNDKSIKYLGCKHTDNNNIHYHLLVLLTEYKQFSNLQIKELTQIFNEMLKLQNQINIVVPTSLKARVSYIFTHKSINGIKIANKEIYDMFYNNKDYCITNDTYIQYCIDNDALIEICSYIDNLQNIDRFDRLRYAIQEKDYIYITNHLQDYKDYTFMRDNFKNYDKDTEIITDTDIDTFDTLFNTYKNKMED